MNSNHDIAKRAELVRGYILGTLNDEEYALVERNMTSTELRSAIEKERARLLLLERSEATEPPRGLAQRTIYRVRESDARRTRQSVAARIWVYGSACAVFALIVAIIFPGSARSGEASRRASCQNNLKQLGIVFKMYAGENRDLLPPLGPYEGIWMFDIASVYPEYLSDLSVLICPNDPEGKEIAEQIKDALAKDPIDYETIARAAARSYTYTGWELRNDADIAAAIRALEQGWASARLEDLNTPQGVIPRLKEGVVRFFETDNVNPADSSDTPQDVPVMFDTISRDQSHNHIPDGGNVLYLDGHVAFLKQGSTFPMTRETQENMGFSSP